MRQCGGRGRVLPNIFRLRTTSPMVAKLQLSGTNLRLLVARGPFHVRLRVPTIVRFRSVFPYSFHVSARRGNFQTWGRVTTRVSRPRVSTTPKRVNSQGLYISHYVCRDGCATTSSRPSHYVRLQVRRFLCFRGRLQPIIRVEGQRSFFVRRVLCILPRFSKGLRTMPDMDFRFLQGFVRRQI